MRHLAIIMDGNGRWAQAKGKARSVGHEAGAYALCRAIEDFVSLDLEVLTVYAFSTENSSRNAKEVGDILGIIKYFLSHNIANLAFKYSLKLRFIGNLSKFPEELADVIYRLEAETMNNIGKTVVFAIGYGGVEEIATCFDRLLKRRLYLNDFSPVTAKEINDNLYTVGLPEPDAVLRYGGYKRLSNFLPIQTAYSELFFSDKLWPDYEKKDILDLISEFGKIKRNFGGV